MTYPPDELPLSSLERESLRGSDTESGGQARSDGVPPEDTASPPEPDASPLPVPASTAGLLAVLMLTGAVVVLFTLMTVNRRASEEFMSSSMARRMNFSLMYWIKYGFLRTGGLPVRTSADEPVYVHRSSTGGRLIGGFLIEKVYGGVTGRYGWRLLAVYNQIVSLVAAALLAALAFRIAIRVGALPMHALVLAVALEAVFITFPDNLALFWGTSGREYWLIFAAIFLLADERCSQSRTRRLTLVQAISAFLFTYMEYVAGIAFVLSYGLVMLILETNRATLKRIGITCIVPALLAVGLHRAQLAYADARFPNLPQEGSAFLFRTGFDGSAKYYGDHLDIAFHRDLAAKNFPKNEELLFRWKWLFLAGATAFFGVIIAVLRGRAPRSAFVVLVALLGSYLLTAAVFSQAVVIHPYLYDVLLLTPLILALFVIGPALLETITHHRGIIVIAVFFLAVWVSMVQMRRYALQYPLPPPKTATR